MAFGIKSKTKKPHIPAIAYEEIAKCIVDPKYFICNYIKIQSDEGGVMLFNLYPYQEELIDAFINNRFNVVLKSRQMGLSWITTAFCVWRLVFFDNENILCVADKQATSTLLIDKVKFMIKNLPDWMKYIKDVNNFDVNNRESIHFNNGSKIVAEASTGNAGVGNTLSYLIIDEAALIDKVKDMWTTLYPAIEKMGRAVVISTPRGASSWFYETYTGAEAGTNGFNAIELGWHLRPGRDDSWARQTINQRGASLFAQEYACQFLGSGSTLIHEKIIQKMESECIEPIYKGIELQTGLWIWKLPIEGHRYVCTIDIASGEGDMSAGESGDTLKTDYTAMHVIDLDTSEVVAEYYGKIRPTPFAKVVYEICVKYNKALFVFERNAGWAITIYDYFMTKNYLSIYHHPKENEKGVADFKNPNNRAGFPTTSSTREKILERLREFIETGQIRIYSKRFTNELKTFSYNIKRERYEATGGAHDDLVLALAIGLYVQSQIHYWKHKDTLLPMATSYTSKAKATIPNWFSNNPAEYVFNKQKEDEQRIEKRLSEENISNHPQQAFTTYSIAKNKEVKVDLSEFIELNKDKKEDNKNVQKSIFEHFIDKEKLEEYKNDTWK